MKATRKELKTRAKEALRGKYGHAVGMTLLYMFILAIITSIVTLISGATNLENISPARQSIGSLVNIIATVFVLIPIAIGFVRYFIKAANDAPDTNNLFYCFRHNFLNTIGVMVMQAIFVFLWSLLFIIPGIIKSYQYLMIEFMLAENPGLDRKRAFELTKIMMRGNKWRFFVFQLSFIGWILLASLTFGIGFLFLIPYMEASYAQFYFELKQNAIEQGILNESELNG